MSDAPTKNWTIETAAAVSPHEADQLSEADWQIVRDLKMEAECRRLEQTGLAHQARFMRYIKHSHIEFIWAEFEAGTESYLICDAIMAASVRAVSMILSAGGYSPDRAAKIAEALGAAFAVNTQSRIEADARVLQESEDAAGKH